MCLTFIVRIRIKRNMFHLFSFLQRKMAVNDVIDGKGGSNFMRNAYDVRAEISFRIAILQRERKKKVHDFAKHGRLSLL